MVECLLPKEKVAGPNPVCRSSLGEDKQVPRLPRVAKYCGQGFSYPAHLIMENIEQHSIKQFNAWAKDYDKKFHLPFYLFNKTVLNFINPKSGSIILDVGCGTGILLNQLFLLNKNLQLYGLDISSEMIKIAKNKLKEVEIKKGSASNLPYKNNIFDYVFCANSFHHYLNSEQSLKEMFRVLKPKGKLILFDPFSNGLSRKYLNRIINVLFHEGDTKIYSQQEMWRMFEKVGFIDIEQKQRWFYKLITIGKKN